MSDWFASTEELPRSRKRLSVVVQALFFTPLALITAAGVAIAIYNIAIGDTGYAVLLVVSGVLAVVLGFQALHYLRDIGAAPVPEEGEVTKKWTKGNLFFFFLPSHYIAVKGKIFAIARMEYAGLLEGDLVRVLHFPHTLTVEFIERFDETEKQYVPAHGGGELR